MRNEIPHEASAKNDSLETIHDTRTSLINIEAFSIIYQEKILLFVDNELINNVVAGRCSD